jgi:tetratricopeptide (TPR) repeat protein
LSYLDTAPDFILHRKGPIMGLRVWFGGDFEHEHERAAFIDLLEQAVAYWSGESAPYALFVDFWVDTAKIDLMAITEHAIVIIDLKDVGSQGGYLAGGLNSTWAYYAMDGSSHMVNAGRVNPYKQVEGYRQTMMRWLKNHAARIFGYQKVANFAPHVVDSWVDAWIVASPSLDEEHTRAALTDIPEQRWFRVLGLDRFWKALFSDMHPGLRITESEIEKMAELHGLIERTNFAGFLWPGTLTQPKPPLFRDPPRYHGSVGRSAEMAEITTALEGGASVLTLIGVPGAGKTHLAAGFAEFAGQKKRLVRWIDCGSTRSCEVSLETLLLALAHEMPPTVERQIVADRDQPQAERIDKALDWCDRERLLIIFDDYNELRPDHGLGTFISGLDQCCHKAQLMIVSNRRPDFLADSRHPLDGAHTLQLNGLPPDDVLDYLRFRSQKGFLHLDLRHTDPQVIWDGTGGIPASLDHLAQLSANRAPERVLLEAGGAEWEETARKLFDGLLGCVSPQARELAESASVVRRGLHADFVLALAEPGRGQLLMNELVDACVLTVIDDHGFVLAGGLKQYLAEMLEEKPESRRRAHARATAYLLQLARQGGPGAFSQKEEALWHASEAGEFGTVLEHGPLIVETLSHQGEYGRALDQAGAAERAAEELERPRDVAYWRIERAAILRHTGKAEESERLCRLGLAIGETLDDKALKARAYHVLGSLALARGDHEAARAYGEAALQLDRRLEHRSHQAASLARLAGLEQQQGRSARAEGLYRESLALVDESDEDPLELARRHFDLSLVQKYDGKLDDALAHLEQARAYAQRTARPAQMVVILGQLAEVKSRLRRHEEALQTLKECLPLRGALTDPAKALITLGIGVDIYIEMGDAAGAAAAFKQLEVEAQTVQDPISQAFLKKRRGLVLLLQGREAEGLALVDEACKVFRAQGRQHWIDDCQATVERILSRADAGRVTPE